MNCLDFVCNRDLMVLITNIPYMNYLNFVFQSLKVLYFADSTVETLKYHYNQIVMFSCLIEYLTNSVF